MRISSKRQLYLNFVHFENFTQIISLSYYCFNSFCINIWVGNLQDISIIELLRQNKEGQFITTIFDIKYVSIKLNNVSRFGGKERNFFDNHSGSLTMLRCRDYHTIFETSI